MKKSLLGFTINELKIVAQELGLPPFVGKQISDWLYRKQVRTFEEMTNLSKVARERLNENYQIGCSTPVDAQHSIDGTIKYLYQTIQGDFIETVYIPDGERATLCVSCQVGCKMRCKFCMTGRQGYVASLSVADILNQIYSLPERNKLTNVVFMGQGEPFDNYDNVLRATEILTADWGYAWSPKRITVSTVGLKKGLEKFLEESKCSLAISLHHPIPKERREIMPAEKAYSIIEMINLLKRYDFCSRRAKNTDSPKQRRLTFEYIVFGGMNDTKHHADALLDLLKDLNCRVNLIRFHTIPDTPFHSSDEKNINWFRDYLTEHGLTTTIRASRGQDIFAACGLLSTKKQQEQKKNQV